MCGSYRARFATFVRAAPAAAQACPHGDHAMTPVEVAGLTKAFTTRAAAKSGPSTASTSRAGRRDLRAARRQRRRQDDDACACWRRSCRRPAGTARVMGHDVSRSEPEEVRRQLGFYSASTALYPRLTGRETLEFFARINGYPEDRVAARVDALIARFGIGEYAGARIDKLSQGMKQKVSIARTIAHDPPVLIFDEPTVGLDVLNALEMQKVIAELRGRGQDDHLLDAHHERGRAAVRPDRHHPPRADPRLRHARRRCARRPASTTSKTSSSTTSSRPAPRPSRT